MLDPAEGASRLAFTLLFLLCTLTLTDTALRLGIRADHQLIKTGPYAVVRHLSYSGGVLAGTGVAPRGIGLAAAGIGLRTRMRSAMLKERLGKEWGVGDACLILDRAWRVLRVCRFSPASFDLPCHF
ncbi:hypothetical protein MVEN_00157400 [Mycena venus]|uniref:Uncharacterized protein n=1 Tax=Mycena venus TaxID=2733690 RepID=A0A8H6YWG0_9AGAR|nr:hypothetical protein MVEN_00157400 [Mycena venus]